jgi:chemotaxis protein MotB
MDTPDRASSVLVDTVPRGLPVLVVALALFVAGCGPEEETTAQAERIEELASERQTLQAELAAARDSLAELQPQTEPTDMVQLGEPIRFPSGSAWIPDRGRRTLDSLATILKREYDSRDFRIKGFTDSRPIGPSLQDTYPSNWYLSSQRAAAVAHYLDTEHDVRSRTLEVGAFGPQNPVASNETAQGRRLNRRVEIQVAE